MVINNSLNHIYKRGEELNSVRKSDLRRYIELRLGKASEVEQMKKMFKKSFQAKTFREFWWY